MTLPEIIYASLGGPINQDSLSRIFLNMNAATQGGAKEVHVLVQSTGGSVSDGIALHNFFKTFPIELYGYNCGAVSSIAVVAFLGIKHRHVSTHGSFMIHKSTLTPQGPMTAAKMRASADYLDGEDARVEAIIRSHTTIPDAIWAQHSSQDVFFSAQQAVDFGIAESIREFQIPNGAQIFQI